MSRVEQSDVIDLAEQYAAGALPPADAEAFEDRLRSGDQRAIDAFERVRLASDAFLGDARPVEPTAALRARVAAIAELDPPKFASQAQTDPNVTDLSQNVVIRAAGAEWSPMDVPGAYSRTLFVDRQAKRLTLLIKLDPGVVYPDHDHPGVEECLVLEGDLTLSGQTLGPSDYIRIPPGGRHGDPTTRNGCVLLVTSPLLDAA